jgi:pilus assembly protein CpaB
MEDAVRRRSNLMVVLGIAFFVVGAAIVYLVVAGDDEGAGSGSASSDEIVDVVVAKNVLEAGANGQDLLTGEAVEVKQVPVDERLPDALTTPNQLGDKILLQGFQPGEQVRLGGLRTIGQAVSIPAGFDAVAVEVPFVQGGANYVQPGDRINVYAGLGLDAGQAAAAAASTPDGAPLPYAVPRVELMLTNVLVLDVNQVVAPLRTQAAAADPNNPTAPARTGSESITFLLALQPDDAEKVIFQQVTDGHLLYVSLAGKDAQPAGPTTGQDDTTILSEEPDAAFHRTNP